MCCLGTKRTTKKFIDSIKGVEVIGWKEFFIQVNDNSSYTLFSSTMLGPWFIGENWAYQNQNRVWKGTRYNRGNPRGLHLYVKELPKTTSWNIARAPIRVKKEDIVVADESEFVAKKATLDKEIFDRNIQPEIERSFKIKTLESVVKLLEL